jgi:hypothetical protein
MPKRQIEVQFPLKGLDESQAFVRQKGGQQGTHTTAKCNNVIGFDPTTGRNRGSARAGLSKYCPDRVSATDAGQCLIHSIGNINNGVRFTTAGSTPPSEVRVTASGVPRTLGANTAGMIGDRVTTLLAVAGGTVALITQDGASTVGDGAKALSTTRQVIAAEAFFQDIYFCDGASYKYYDISANMMVPWSATEETGGTIPSLAANTQVITAITTAAPNVVTVAAHGLSDGDQVQITGVLGKTTANGTWTISGVTTNTFELVGSSAGSGYTSGGTCSRINDTKCTLMAVWGGRIVMSGLATDPHNIFMSAVGDPFDWNYAPDIQTIQQAIAGNITSGYGKNPDIVTALIPYTDDILLIGGTHSIRKFLGNPAEGGINVSVTEITGVAYGSAWCQSPEGIIYFFGSRGGVYRMNPENGIPQRMTSTTIDERLSDINLSTNIVTLTWDDRAIAVRVYISPTDGTAGTHYVWDVRNEAWWPFSYSDSLHNPQAIHLLAGNTPTERLILEYGQDGYIRMVDVDTESDDGSPIESYVYIGPFSGMMLLELAAILREGSNNVNWSIVSASSAEKALDASPRQTGRFRAGQNQSHWPRAFLETGYIRLDGTGSWAVEKLSAVVEEANETMIRVMRSNN